MNYKDFDLKQTITPKRWQGLLRLVTGYGWLYLLAFVFVGFAALANTGIFLVISAFVDDVLPLEDMGNLLAIYAFAVVGLALAQAVFSAISGRWAALVSEKVVQRLRDFLYDHMQRLSFGYHDRMQTGEMLSRATSDVDTIRKVYAEQAIGFGRIFFVFVVSFTALARIDLQLALLSIVVIPILLITSTIFFKLIEKRFEALQEQESILTSRLQESLAGVRVVRAFARQSFEQERFEKVNAEKFRRGRRLVQAHAGFWPSTDLISGLQVVFALFIGGRMVLIGTLSTGDYLASIGLVNQLIWPIRNIGRLLSEISMGLVSFGRISEIIRHDRELLHGEGTWAPDHPIAGHIRFDNVSFKYEGDGEGESQLPTVLHDIDFAVEAGQTVALLGSTGSGKTTLVNLLPGFYDYLEGSITLDGVELSQFSREYLRANIGIVMQEAFLFAATIRDNIKYGAMREVSDEEVYAAAEAAAIHDVILDFPQGYDTIVGERGVTLSGGQKQRLTLARTILKRPSLLILDDATSAVDTETESRIREALLAGANRGEQQTTFIIAHRIQSVMHADLILVMDEGRIIERGTHESLLAVDGTYSRIYELQAGIEEELQAELGMVEAHDDSAEPVPA